MRKSLIVSTMALICITINLVAQLFPHEAVNAMAEGINMGNTLDLPGGEGSWNNPSAEEYYFIVNSEVLSYYFFFIANHL